MTAADAPQLKKTMGLFALTIYGIGDMLGAGIYALIGTAAREMGNALWVGFVAAALAAAFTGLSYASLGSRYPRAAGAAYVIQRAFGVRILAYTLGLMTMASGLLSFAAGANAFAEQLHKQIAPAAAPAAASAPAADAVAATTRAGASTTAAAPAAAGWTSRVKFWPYILGYIGLLTLINFWGMRESNWMNAVCTFIEVGGLIVVILVGMRYWGSVNYLETAPVSAEPDAPLKSMNLSFILSGGILVFYAFIGFEDMINVSEEVKDVERVFPRALLMAVGVTTVIYLLVAITAVSVIPAAELGKPGASLVNVVKKAAPWFPPGLFPAISLFAIANTGLLNYIMGSRVVYGMSRQGLLPAFLGKLHKTRHTPHVAILLLMCIVTVLALTGGISDLAQGTSLLLLVVFAVINVSLIVLRRRPGEPRGTFDVPVLVPIIGALICAALVVSKLWSAFTTPTVAGKSPPWLPAALAGGMAVLIVLLYFVMKPKHVAAEE
jgi:amino acid transporter